MEIELNMKQGNLHPLLHPSQISPTKNPKTNPLPNEASIYKKKPITTYGN